MSLKASSLRVLLDWNQGKELSMGALCANHWGLQPVRTPLAATSLSSALCKSLRLALAITLPICAPLSLLAATRQVSTCSDSGSGSLRAAFANLQSGDVIAFDSLTCSKITIDSSLTTAVDHFRIQGPTSKSLVLQSSGSDRLINHTGEGQLYLAHLTIQGGKYTNTMAKGGCIFSYGSVELFHTGVNGCLVEATGSTPAAGGGVYAKGSLGMQNSTVTGNFAVNTGSGVGIGGGAYTLGGLGADASVIDDNTVEGAATSNSSLGGGVFVVGYITMTNSTVSNNHADIGGGLYLSMPDSASNFSEFSNSTISGNSAKKVGGVFVHGLGDFEQVTIANNSETVQTGAGLYVTGVIRLISDIIATNRVGSNPSDLGGTASTIFNSSGHNIIVLSLLPNVPPDTRSTDPMLGALRDNGGPTHTQALLIGSPAIDHADPAQPYVYDQRGMGFPRKIGGAADIGAFEFNADVIFINGFE
jgi:hypothetical protein